MANVAAVLQHLIAVWSGDLTRQIYSSPLTPRPHPPPASGKNVAERGRVRVSSEIIPRRMYVLQCCARFDTPGPAGGSGLCGCGSATRDCPTLNFLHPRHAPFISPSLSLCSYALTLTLLFFPTQRKGTVETPHPPGQYSTTNANAVEGKNCNRI